MESEKQRLLDNWLEEALQQRATVEPRPGLEGRILVRLRAESNRMPALAWHWRPVWFGLAAAVLLGTSLFLVWRSGTGSHRTTEVRPFARRDGLRTPESVEVSNPARAQAKRPPKRASAPAAVARVVPRAPRLPQFPSPQPLSEQEKMLARYASQFPREAVLIALDQDELAKREDVEMQQTKPSLDFADSPDKPNQLGRSQ